MTGGLWILKAGDAVAEVAARRGDFPKWIRDTVGDGWGGPWREHDLRSDAAPPALSTPAVLSGSAGSGGVRGFIVTGSSSSVIDRAPWLLRAEEYIRAIVASGTPLLGICFGHQLIAQALGGLVTRNPRGREIGTVRCQLVAPAPLAAQGDPLFAGVPETFDVNATHVDTVARLPVGARVLASTALEPTAAFAIGEPRRARVYGVQFHPEFDGDVVRGYVTARAHVIRVEGGDPDAIGAAVTDAPYGARILRNFAEGIHSSSPSVRGSMLVPTWGSTTTSAVNTTG